MNMNKWKDNANKMCEVMCFIKMKGFARTIPGYKKDPYLAYSTEISDFWSSKLIIMTVSSITTKLS
jgi:hypothetical protein